jgi:glutathione S-transferase
VLEDNPRKGPKCKNPWIELDGERIGDSEFNIELLSKRYGVDLDAGLSSEQKAIGLAWRRAFEEHFHQVLEWELFEHPAGATYMRERMRSSMPPVIGPLVFSMLRSHLQLYARGLARHTPDIIAAKGRADVDALAAFLGDKPFLLGQFLETGLRR